MIISFISSLNATGRYVGRRYEQQETPFLALTRTVGVWDGTISLCSSLTRHVRIVVHRSNSISQI